MTTPVCAVVGVGPGNGAAFARRFAADGYAVAMLARDDAFTKQLEASVPNARGWKCEVVVFNAGSGVFGTFDTVAAADFEAAWRVNALGAFLVAKQVVPAMKERGK